jgi:PAS domain-containing protein
MSFNQTAGTTSFAPHRTRELSQLAAREYECARLRAELQAQTQAWEHLFAHVPMACVAADAAGNIVEANPAAGRLLNIGPRRLKGRELLLFATDRQRFASVLRQAVVHSAPIDVPMVLRPRERKPVPVRVRVVPPLPGGSDVWLWFFAPASEFDVPAGAETGAPTELLLETD